MSLPTSFAGATSFAGPTSFAPKTLSFSTATLRNQKTLVWLQHQNPSVPWWRWDGVVTSMEDYYRWQSGRQPQQKAQQQTQSERQAQQQPQQKAQQQTQLGRSIVGIILTEPTIVGGEIDAWLEEVYHVSKEVMYMVLSQACLQWKPEAYWKENFDNLFVLEGLYEMYPFLGGEWNGTVEDAIRMLGLICRYHRLVVPDAGPFHHLQEKRPFYEMTVEEGSRPAEFVLVTQYYTAKDKKRGVELRECLRRNVKCKWVDRIVLLTERDESVAWASFIGKDKAKIEQRIIGKRLTYGDFFREVGRRFSGANGANGANAVVALANADIYFGEELAEAWRMDWRDRAICLLRWDDLGEGPQKARLFGPRPDSQDVWMFSALSIVERHWAPQDVDIPLGLPGCDNAILRPLLQQRLLLSNPALSLKTYHLHNSGVRSYTKKDTVASSVYIHLEPTYLIDSKQEFVPRQAPQHICHEVVSFTVRSSSLSDEITYCTMLEKGGRFHWEPMVENYAFEPAIPVYTWKGGAGVTSNGLVYDLYRIYTGRAALQQPEFNFWASAKVDIFTPFVSCPRMAAIPLRDAGRVFQSWSAYVLFYLSSYLRLAKECVGCSPLSFWLPRGFEERMMRTFPSVDVSLGLPWEEGMACWAEEVVGFLPGPTGAEIGREEIAALRAAYLPLSAAAEAKSSKKCIVWRGGCWTSESIRQWSTEYMEPRGWQVVEVSEASDRLEEILGEASVMIWDGQAEQLTQAEQLGKAEQPGQPGQWLWCLPKGARVVEGQDEQDIQGEAQHVAHVADLDARVFLFGRGSTLYRVAEWREKLESTDWFS